MQVDLRLTWALHQPHTIQRPCGAQCIPQTCFIVLSHEGYIFQRMLLSCFYRTFCVAKFYSRASFRSFAAALVRRNGAGMLSLTSMPQFVVSCACCKLAATHIRQSSSNYRQRSAALQRQFQPRRLARHCVQARGLKQAKQARSRLHLCATNEVDRDCEKEDSRKYKRTVRRS